MSDAGEMQNTGIGERVPGRECGTCTLCCKVFRIDEVESPPNQWCRHCAPGKGCTIHETRPQVCRGYFCLWFYQPGLGPEWKPEKSKIILNSELNGQRIAAHVDASAPGAWRREPYYGALKRWSADALKRQQQVSVWIGQHCIVILPDKEIDLGVVAPDEVVVSTTRTTPEGPVYGAKKMKRVEAEAQQQRWAEAKTRLDFSRGDTAAR
jgi:hypothetical protein